MNYNLDSQKCFQQKKRGKHKENVLEKKKKALLDKKSIYPTTKKKKKKKRWELRKVLMSTWIASGIDRTAL